MHFQTKFLNLCHEAAQTLNQVSSPLAPQIAIAPGKYIFAYLDMVNGYDLALKNFPMETGKISRKLRDLNQASASILINGLSQERKAEFAALNDFNDLYYQAIETVRVKIKGLKYGESEAADDFSKYHENRRDLLAAITDNLFAKDFKIEQLRMEISGMKFMAKRVDDDIDQIYDFTSQYKNATKPIKLKFKYDSQTERNLFDFKTAIKEIKPQFAADDISPYEKHCFEYIRRVVNKENFEKFGKVDKQLRKWRGLDVSVHTPASEALKRLKEVSNMLAPAVTDIRSYIEMVKKKSGDEGKLINLIESFGRSR